MPARREDLLLVLRDAHAFYGAQVGASWVPDHLNRRNLYRQMEPAQIGYAPAGWTVTTDHLRCRGYADELLVEAGLSRPARTGRLIDHFRDRLIFPLRTAEGDLVGFIGRCPTNAGADVPKYLNSPQTAVFSKHEVLYGLGESHYQLRPGSLLTLVEGPMDRLAITAAMPSATAVGVAPCGTALTSQQAAALVRAAGVGRPIGVALDPDAAGRVAHLARLGTTECDRRSQPFSRLAPQRARSRRPCTHGQNGLVEEPHCSQSAASPRRSGTANR